MNNPLTETISNQLLNLSALKQNIRIAIENMGQDMTNVPFTQYAEKINAIQVEDSVHEKLFPIYQQENEPENKTGLWIKKSNENKLPIYFANENKATTEELIDLGGIDTSVLLNKSLKNFISDKKGNYFVIDASDNIYKYNKNDNTLTYLNNPQVPYTSEDSKLHGLWEGGFIENNLYLCCSSTTYSTDTSYIYTPNNKKNVYFYKFDTINNVFTRLKDLPLSNTLAITSIPFSHGTNYLFGKLIPYKNSIYITITNKRYKYETENNIFSEVLSENFLNTMSTLYKDKIISISSYFYWYGNQANANYLNNRYLHTHFYNLESYERDNKTYVLPHNFARFNSGTRGNEYVGIFFPKMIYNPIKSRTETLCPCLAYRNNGSFFNIGFGIEWDNYLNDHNNYIYTLNKINFENGSNFVLGMLGDYDRNSLLYINNSNIIKEKRDIIDNPDGLYLFFDFFKNSENGGYNLNESAQYVKKVLIFENGEQKFYDVYMGNGYTWEFLYEH